MPLFTVIIPTHSHVASLTWAIQSVLGQTLQDFELIVIGDGAPQATGLLMNDWCARDDRIKFQPNTKGAGFGELHRHNALQSARGTLVAYLGDDDLWLPHHLETLSELLSDNDMAHTAPTVVSPQGQVHVLPAGLDNAFARTCLLKLEKHGCGLSSVGHTMAAYRKLPIGWRPKPENRKSDTHMWLQWLSQDWVKVGYKLRVSTLHLGSPRRHAMSDEQRGEESGLWFARSLEPGFEDEVTAGMLDHWRGKIFQKQLDIQMLESLIEGKPIPPESTALFAAHIGQRSPNFARFMLRKALLAQQNSQWEVAEQLYFLIEGKLKTDTELLWQAKYLLNRGDYACAEQVLSNISDNDPEIAERKEKLRTRCKNLQRKNAGKAPETNG